MKPAILWLPFEAIGSFAINCVVTVLDASTNNAPENPLKQTVDDVRSFWRNDATDINDKINRQRKDENKWRA